MNNLALRAYTDDYASTAILTLTITPDNLQALTRHAKSTLELIKRNHVPIDTVTTPNPLPARLHWTDDETQDAIRQQSLLTSNPDPESILGLLPNNSPILTPGEFDITFRLNHQQLAIFNKPDPVIAFWVEDDHEPLPYRTAGIPISFLEALQQQLQEQPA